MVYIYPEYIVSKDVDLHIETFFVFLEFPIITKAADFSEFAGEDAMGKRRSWW